MQQFVLSNVRLKGRTSLIKTSLGIENDLRNVAVMRNQRKDLEKDPRKKGLIVFVAI